MMLWREGRPKMRYGYTDMGPIQIPTLPTYIVLTDRADGKLWLLEYSTTTLNADGAGYVGITTVLPTNRPYITFAANEEPYFPGTPLTRLIVRGGYLGAETANPDNAADHDNLILAARNGLNLTFAQLIFSTSTPGSYGFRLVTA